VPTTRPASARSSDDALVALDAVQRDALTELLRLTPVVDRLGELFAAAGHELYLVGGSVRDALLGRLGNDLDFTTSARPDDIEALLRRFSPAVWTIGKEFGTVGCRVADAGTDWVVEVTTFRSDAYSADSRKPAVVFGDAVEGDLRRRDFTVNAMAVELPSRRFVDPYSGLRRSPSATTRCG
jgi:poly(A) polymerase